MESHKKLLLSNKAWVQEKLNADPDFFKKLEHDQRPEFLWIGCSDSRVPAEEITGASPGELFVHRNVANVVVHTDFNLLSVLQYAVEVLEVKHVIVCGHYGCGGVKNALSRKHLGLINKWLRHIKDVYRFHERELETISDPNELWRRMVEINVLEQVKNLAETSIVQHCWRKEKRPMLHGWVYDLHNGLIKTICTMTSESHMEGIYEYEFDDAPRGVADVPPKK